MHSYIIIGEEDFDLTSLIFRYPELVRKLHSVVAPRPTFYFSENFIDPSEDFEGKYNEVNEVQIHFMWLGLTLTCNKPLTCNLHNHVCMPFVSHIL